MSGRSSATSQPRFRDGVADQDPSDGDPWDITRAPDDGDHSDEYERAPSPPLPMRSPAALHSGRLRGRYAIQEIISWPCAHA